jgi:hypothetical protein
MMEERVKETEGLGMKANKSTIESSGTHER